GPISRDVLTAGDTRSQSAAVPFFEQVQREPTRARRRAPPQELAPHRLPQWLDLLRIASKRVEARRKVVHAVHEEAQVDAWAPGNSVPRHGSLGLEVPLSLMIRADEMIE